MSTAVDRQQPAPRPPRRRRKITSLVALGVALVLVVAALVWWWPRQDERDLTGSATVVASSTAAGYSAADVVQPGPGGAPGAGWRSAGETTGAWLELSWRRSYSLHEITIVRNPLTEPGATDGLLTFDDGSAVQVRLSTTDRTTTIPITPRNVVRFRFSVAAAASAASDVTINEILVRATSGDDDVATDGAPGGNAAAAATVTQSPDAGSADPHALTDGSGTSDAAQTGADWVTSRGAGEWVQLQWARPRELTSVQLLGSARSAARLAAATATFDDGSTLPIGAVLTDPGRPTTVAFLPRVTRSVRVQFDRVDGTGAFALAELRAYQRGATPLRSSPAEQPTPETPAPCVDTPASPSAPLVVRCPTTGSTVDGSVDLQVATMVGYSAVTATVWPADAAAPVGEPVRVTPDAGGLATLAVDSTVAAPGPFTVAVEATGYGRATATVYFQLYRRGVLGGDVTSGPAAVGRNLVYDEEFDRPVSLSRPGLGADYAAAKPDHDGADDFGAAIFADPGKGPDTVRVVDDHYLRIDVAPLAAGTTDPQGYNRQHVGGLLASARQGGSGFSAQYGYFEARMLAPAAPGTWPAFWMLPSDNLIAPTPAVAEIDAIELYGHDPKGGCMSTHGYLDGKDGGTARCGQRQQTERAALAWHTYGASVLPTGITFYVDGQAVASSPQVVGGSAPLFFLLDLALGGGWPVQLQGVQDRASLYVDYVRVYV